MQYLKACSKHRCTLYRFRYFSEGLRMVENFGGYVEDLSSKLVHIASDQEKERRELIDITNTLKNSPGFNKVVSYSII